MPVAPLVLPALQPPLWATNGHVQTLAGVWLAESAPQLVSGLAGVVRHDIALSCGDTLVSLEAAPTAPPAASCGDPWVIHLFHGLTGSSDSTYIRRAAARFRGAGHTVVAVNHRGAGLGAGRARGMYHSGVAADVRAALAAGRERFPVRRHLAIGYSLSGNALLLALGRDRGRPGLPDAAIAVNPPVDLAACVGRLERWRNKLYDANFVRGCARLVEQRVALGLLPPQPRFSLTDSIRDFDELVTAPLAGFAGADDYYTRCSARPWLASIEVPTFVLTSCDDPLIDWRDSAEAPRSPAVTLHVARHGGHMGYLARGRGRRVHRWLEDALSTAFDHLRASAPGPHTEHRELTREPATPQPG